MHFNEVIGDGKKLGFKKVNPSIFIFFLNRSNL